MTFGKTAIVTSLPGTGGDTRRRDDFVSLRRSQSGFSAIEVLIVLAIVAILAAIGVPSLNKAMAGIRANTAAAQVASTLRKSRELAMSAETYVRIQFANNNEMLVDRWCTPEAVAGDNAAQGATPGLLQGCAGGTPNAWNPVQPYATDPSATLEHNQFIHRGQASPEGFGPSGQALAFDGSPGAIMFTPNGFLVDAPAGGSPMGNWGTVLNGTVFVGDPNKADIVRAVSILGSVGRVRTYTWSGGSGGKWIR